MIGVLVTLVKLSTVAQVLPGVALWSFGALVAVLAAILSFPPCDLWHHLAPPRCARDGQGASRPRIPRHERAPAAPPDRDRAGLLACRACSAQSDGAGRSSPVRAAALYCIVESPPA